LGVICSLGSVFSKREDNYVEGSILNFREVDGKPRERQHRDEI